MIPAGNGIIHNRVEKTIAHLGLISDPGMMAADQLILDAMIAE